LADNSYYASDGLGAFFYIHAKPDTFGIFNLPVTPQVDYSSAGIITDIANWTLLTRTFVADSAYTHLIIGDFKDDASIGSTVVGGTAGIKYAYYYIDSVAIESLSYLSTVTADQSVRASLYPNPFTEHTILNIENSIGNNYELFIFNFQGVLVRKMNITSNHTTIQRSDLGSGFYMYQLRTGNSIVCNGRMIIQ
jgi:hypothetical protein